MKTPPPKTFKVRLEYHSVLTETVEAESKEAAIRKVKDENWDMICINLSAYSEEAKEV